MKALRSIFPSLFFMAFVYTLQSLSKRGYYIGSTHGLEKRMHRHNSGYEFSRKSMLSIKLVTKKYYETIGEARRVGRKLKKLKRRDYIEKIIASGKIHFRI